MTATKDKPMEGGISPEGPVSTDAETPDYWEDKIMAAQSKRILNDAGYMGFTKHEDGELYPCLQFKDNETRANFIRAAEENATLREQLDANAAHIGDLLDVNKCYQQAKEENAALRAECFTFWKACMTMKKNNTPEWMEYFAECMAKFEKAFSAIKSGDVLGGGE